MLYLIPTYLGEHSSIGIFSKQLIETVKNLQHFIVENEKSARKFIRFIHPEVDQSSLSFQLIDKRFTPEELPKVVQDLKAGKEVGLLSEAGTPCIADPGNVIVEWAHQNQIKVKPLVGPSSIYLALMASGFNGQNFQFHGYLPLDKNERKKTLRYLESESQKEDKTQIFMETPYRNNGLMEDLSQNLQNSTLLCVALNLTLEDEEIHMKSIQDWKNSHFDFHKKPAIFLMYSK